MPTAAARFEADGSLGQVYRCLTRSWVAFPTMHGLILLALALALTIDSFAVSVALGLSCRKTRPARFWTIPLTFAVVQGAMPLLGWCAGFGLKQIVEGIDHWVAFCLLALIGANMIRGAMSATSSAAEAPGENESAGDSAAEGTVAESATKPRRLSRRRLLSLAVATSIDAFAVGLTMPLLDVSPVAFPLLVGSATFAVSSVGLCAGHRVGHWFERRAEWVGGLVLIGIGVNILVTHLSA